MVQGNLSALPRPLRPLIADRRWLIWKWEVRSGKPSKVPYRPDNPQRKAKSDDRSTWGSYQAALAAVDAEQCTGIGLCLQGSNLVAFDLDHCRDPITGTLTPWAWRYVERAASYTEITVSGTGLRVIGIGSGGNLQNQYPMPGDGAQIEVYRNTNRYIVMTGLQVPGTPDRFAQLDALADQVVAELDAAKAKGKAKPKANGADREPSHPLDLKHLIESGDTSRWNSRSEGAFYVACQLARQGQNAEQIAQVLHDPKNGISAHFYDQTDPWDTAQRFAADAIAKLAEGGPVLSATDHMERGRMFKQQHRAPIIHWRDELHDWNDGPYASVAEREIRAAIAKFLDHAQVKGKKGALHPFEPNRNSIAETLEAVKNLSHLSARVSPPFWLDGRTDPAPQSLIAFPNGLLNWRTGTLLPATPEFFTQHACSFPYDPAAPSPVRWYRFLEEVFLGEQDQVDTLQEMIGYCLTPDTSFQKMFLIVGPGRSGKGTIAGVICSLLAEGIVCGPNMASFESHFGLLPLIGRHLAIIDDMRIGPKTDKWLITERLLTISGEGYITIDRKNLSAWHGVLPIKFLIISNAVPAFADDSGVVASRFITLTTRRSFYENEDKTLPAQLRRERAGILLWALEGLRRLHQRDKFAEPSRNADMKATMAAAASPYKGFLDDCCVLEPAAMVPTEALYQRYVVWMQDNKLTPTNKAHFGIGVIAAGNGKIALTRPVIGPRQVAHYAGVRLLTDKDVPI